MPICWPSVASMQGSKDSSARGFFVVFSQMGILVRFKMVNPLDHVANLLR